MQKINIKKSAVFIGHNECWDINKTDISTASENLIQQGIEVFFSGGMGRFDWLGAEVIYDLKKKYPQIKNILVIPYLHFNIRDENIFD